MRMRVDRSAYREANAIGSTELRAFAVSPWHAHRESTRPYEAGGGAAAAAGTLIHAAILEGDYDGDDSLRAKLGMSRRDHRARLDAAREAIKAVWDLVEKHSGHPRGVARVESGILWNVVHGDEEVGYAKALIDIELPGGVIDLKTTTREDQMSPRGWAARVARERLDIQLGHYANGAEAMAAAWIIVGQNEGMPPPVMYRLSTTDLQRAKLEAHDLTIRWSLRKRQGPPYETGWGGELELPPWYAPDDAVFDGDEGLA